MERLNRKLGRTECVMKFDNSLYPIFLSKLADVWKVVEKVNLEEQPIIMARSEYTIYGNRGTMVFVFSDKAVPDDVILDFIMKHSKKNLVDTLMELIRRK